MKIRNFVFPETKTTLNHLRKNTLFFCLLSLAVSFFPLMAQSSGQATSNELAVSSTLPFSFFSGFFIFCALVGIALSIFIWGSFRRKNPEIVFLAIFLFFISEYQLEWDLLWSRTWNASNGVPFYRVAFYIWLPMLYLYMKSLSNGYTKSQLTLKQVTKHSLLFVLLIPVYAIAGPLASFFSVSWERLAELVLYNTWLKSVYTIGYGIMFYNLYRHSASRLKPLARSWYLSLLVFLCLFLIGLIFTSVFIEQTAVVSAGRVYFALLFSFLHLLLGLHVWMHPDLFRPEEYGENTHQVADSCMVKYQNSGLTDALLLSLKDDLLALLDKEPLYLNCELSLQDLADKLGTDRYAISQVINQGIGKNFYEFLGDYRIQKACELFREQGDSLRVVDVAYQSGFSNRVSFNKAFKKRTGLTPSAYINTYSTEEAVA